LLMALIANAAQSSSEVKQVAIAAPEATEETGIMGANKPRASERATENTQKLCYISINSCLPCRGTNQIGECRDRAGDARRLGGSMRTRRGSITPRYMLPPPTSCHHSCRSCPHENTARMGPAPLASTQPAPA